MSGHTWPVLAVLALAGPAFGQLADQDADGRAEQVAAALVSDLDRDGEFEFYEIAGQRLVIIAGQSRGELVFADSMEGIWAADADADGRSELYVARDAGRVLEIPTALVRAVLAGEAFGEVSEGLLSTCGDLAGTWDSGSDLNNLWDAAAGDFDGDRRVDLLGENWPTPTMRVYENDENDHFVFVFSTPVEDAPPGAYVAVTGGDSDQDGQGEIIGGETSTLNQVFLYESPADNTYVKRTINIREPDPSGNLSMGSVRIADADRDGKREIIFDTSDVSGAKLFIYEHSGQAGENIYTKVYTYSTVSYLFNWTIGDSDNDGSEEIVLGFGGGGGFPINLRRLENTGDNQFVHKILQPGGVGLALGPVVADLDGDGQNELAFGGAVSGQGGGVFIYEATGDDAYTLVYQDGVFSGNGLCSDAGKLQCGTSPVVAVGHFSGELGTWRYNGSAYERAFQTPPARPGALRSVSLGQLDGDLVADVLFSSHSADDRLNVYESLRLGDLNCDDAVDFGDITPFVLALSDPEEYRRQYPDCELKQGDCNRDGLIDFGDINPFVNLLSGRDARR